MLSESGSFSQNEKNLKAWNHEQVSSFEGINHQATQKITEISLNLCFGINSVAWVAFDFFHPPLWLNFINFKQLFILNHFNQNQLSYLMPPIHFQTNFGILHFNRSSMTFYLAPPFLFTLKFHRQSTYSLKIVPFQESFWNFHLHLGAKKVRLVDVECFFW